jgi:hypothetical protein
MGWKNIKEHYRIKHQLRVSEGGICIGSAYISDILIINFDGVLIKRYEDRSNDDILRYQSEIDADPILLKRLVQTQDRFTASIPVYTYADGSIVEKQCEIPGWPNVTHDGDMMYENTYSTDKAQVIEWAKRNASLAVKCGLRDVEEAEKALSDARSRLDKYKSDELKLVEAHGATATTADNGDKGIGTSKPTNITEAAQLYFACVEAFDKANGRTLSDGDRSLLSSGFEAGWRLCTEVLVDLKANMSAEVSNV